MVTSFSFPFGYTKVRFVDAGGPTTMLMPPFKNVWIKLQISFSLHARGKPGMVVTA